jgi:hypothetical protein
MRLLANKAEARRIANSIGLPAGPLSYTQVNTWLMCHRAYYHQYVKHTPRDSWSENLVLGSGMHSGLEFANKQKMKGEPIDLAGASRAIHTSVYHELDKNKAELDRSQKAKLEKQLSMLDQLLELWVNQHLAGYNPTGVEETSYVLLGGIPMTIKIDLIDDGRKVSDFKLTGTFKNEKAVKESLQLSLYAAATEILVTSFISLRMPKFGLKKGWKPEIEEVVVRKKIADLKWAEEVTASVSKGILMGDWSLCDPSEWKCSPDYCDVWTKCRGKNMTETKRPKFMQNMLKRSGL